MGLAPVPDTVQGEGEERILKMSWRRGHHAMEQSPDRNPAGPLHGRDGDERSGTTIPAQAADGSLPA